ncbi:NAD(P)H-dependent flavin oxidoreductase [Occultella aeris]|nr:nitronate monooxygenase family protein [Occultella aeris]
MTSWPDTRILDLFGISAPIVLAPMAGPVLADLTVAVAQAGGLGSLPCALLPADRIRAELTEIRSRTDAAINLNFFCHTTPEPDPVADLAWRARLAPYYVEAGLDPSVTPVASNRNPFDGGACEIIEEFRPEAVSFHFGLPEAALLERVRATGAKVLGCATTVAEARWLADRGADLIIAQGAEAGGHRGMFLSTDVGTQVGTFALVPQVVDAVDVPVIAAGGIGDPRAIVAALALGAAAVQIGTAYLYTPEARIAVGHRKALLEQNADDATALTNVFTGRPARGIVNRAMRELGPMSEATPPFPRAGGALAPLRSATEPAGSTDFMSLWSGQAGTLSARYAGLSAAELTRTLAREALARL